MPSKSEIILIGILAFVLWAGILATGILCLTGNSRIENSTDETVTGVLGVAGAVLMAVLVLKNKMLSPIK